MKRRKLFIPGPTEVSPEVLQALARPPIGHRTEEMKVLITEITAKLRKLLCTRQTVLLSTTSATALMEASVRNLVKRDVLCTICGAFGERWYEIALANGKRADRLDFPWGKAVDPDDLKKALRNKRYDAVTLVHNETSTGVISPLEEIADVVREFPETLLLVDTVSSMASVPIDFDRLRIDVCLASVQKGLALPPGFALCAISDRALRRASEVENRGFYLDFLEMKKYADRGQTPTTPSVPHLYALNLQLDRILTEGMTARYQRHLRMARMVQSWARRRFSLFAEASSLSPTVTAIATSGQAQPAQLLDHARRNGYLLAPGYGPLKDRTFRIAHMGDLTENDVGELLDCLEGFFE